MTPVSKTAMKINGNKFSVFETTVKMIRLRNASIFLCALAGIKIPALQYSKPLCTLAAIF
jgi:hypothetical protein